MDIHTLLDQLVGPAAYPHPVDRVIVLQTHISVVFLAGPFAYKVKKPVALGFLDFSTPDRRHHACDDEVRLNRRLAPHVYLGVVTITCDQGRLQVDGPGEPVDWAVKMVRLADGASLLDRITRGEIVPANMGRLAQFLAAFHRRAGDGPQVADFGRFEVVAGNARENLTQSETHVGTTISRSVFDRLRTLTDLTLGRLRPLIENRAARGVPRDTHGDLHLDHVYFDSSRPPPTICSPSTVSSSTSGTDTRTPSPTSPSSSWTSSSTVALTLQTSSRLRTLPPRTTPRAQPCSRSTQPIGPPSAPKSKGWNWSKRKFRPTRKP